MIVGIGGGIGTGKSVVSRVLRLKGYEVYDCDFEAKNLMDNSPEIKQALSQRFGSRCIKADGMPDRAVIAACVFKNTEDRLWLNSLVHDRVLQDVISRFSGRDEGIFFVESAIQATSGLYRICDEIWLVEAPIDIRYERIGKRDGLNPDEIKKRIESQSWEIEMLRDKIDTKTIINDGSTPILKQINKLLKQIKK